MNVETGSRRITLIDDNPLDRELLAAHLRERGFHVSTESSAEHAFTSWVADPPYAVICPANMTDINPFGLCRSVKGTPSLESIQMIMLSGAESLDLDRERGREAGVDVVIDRDQGYHQIVDVLLRALPQNGNGAAEAADREPLDAGESEVADVVETAGVDDAPTNKASDAVLADLRARFLVEGRWEMDRLIRKIRRGESPDLSIGVVRRWRKRGQALGCERIAVEAATLAAALDDSDTAVAETALCRLVVLFGGAEQPQHVMRLTEPLERTEMRDGSANSVSRVTSISDAGIHIKSIAPRSERAIPDRILRGLTGMRCALLGFEPDEVQDITLALARAGAEAESIAWRPGLPGSLALGCFDLAVLSAATDSVIDHATLGRFEQPVLIAGRARRLLTEVSSLPHHHLLLAPWTPSAVVLRAFLALHAPPAARATQVVHGEPAQVVLADDDVTITALVGTTLTNYGYQCHLVHDGDEALERIRGTNPQAVIVDINMPGMDGYEVLVAMKNDPQLREIPVVLLTARQQEADIIRGFELGAAEYIVKPFNPMELVARLKRLLPAGSPAA